MKEKDVLYLMKYLLVINVFGILLMLTLRLDYPRSVEGMEWTPLYIPFCYQIEPLFGLWSSYLIMVVPILVMIALWRKGVKYKLFLQAMFRIEIYKYVVVIILRLYWAFAGIRFIWMDYLCVGASVLMIFALRMGLKELKAEEELKRFSVWGGCLFICLAILVPLISTIQYNEGIPATNRNIYMLVKLDKPGVIAETRFRVVRYSPREIEMVFDSSDLEAIDEARFEKSFINNGGTNLGLLLNVYKESGGTEQLIYSDEINRHNDLRYRTVNPITFKQANLEQGLYRAELKCITPSDEYSGLKVRLLIFKTSNYWKFFK